MKTLKIAALSLLLFPAVGCEDSPAQKKRNEEKRIKEEEKQKAVEEYRASLIHPSESVGKTVKSFEVMKSDLILITFDDESKISIYAGGKHARHYINAY